MSSVEKPAVGNNDRKSSKIPTKTESRSSVCPASSPSGGRLRARHTSERHRKPGVLNSSSSQENVAPSSVKKLHPKRLKLCDFDLVFQFQQVSSPGQFYNFIDQFALPVCIKVLLSMFGLCSNMSYMELKRRHEGLMSEVQALGQQSKDVASQHQAEVNHLSEEIQFYKVLYIEVTGTRSSLLF